MRGATLQEGKQAYGSNISIHAPHAGRDLRSRSKTRRNSDFNPRAPCGARHTTNNNYKQYVNISIHAPHAGRDRFCKHLHLQKPYFNPRAPCGARRNGRVAPIGPRGFQSTRPMRGATLQEGKQAYGSNISIHAPHAGRDLRSRSKTRRNSDFNPRAPCGARHTTNNNYKQYVNISIHAPHAGRDRFCKHLHLQKPYFNPRAPCGARRNGRVAPIGPRGFQSTRPMRGATLFDKDGPGPKAFQSTRPMRGATR